MKQAIGSSDPSRNYDSVAIAGIFLVVFGFITSLLVVFVLPSVCSFVSVFELLLTVTVFFGGLGILLVRKFWWRRA